VKKPLLIVFLVLLSGFQMALHAADSLKVIRNRRLITGITGVTVYSGTMYSLNQFWYSDFPRSPMHSFNDSREWLQMDKAGHFFTSWYLGVTGIRSADWIKMKGNKAIWLGGSLGLVFLTGIELLDGTSAQWGFSWTDAAANTLGAGFAISQHLLWKKQKLLLKFSYRNNGESALRPQLLGSSMQERWIKDYNGQTYWLSFSPGAFLPATRIPPWLCLSLGYSASGMLGANNNEWAGSALISYGSLKREREWFLSADIDLSAVPYHAPWFRTFTTWFNFLKIPFPGINLGNGEVFWLIP
jgi:uncharacterized protein YfiM (DUF2279 family)